MRIQIVAIGRLKDGSERELYARYADRIGVAGRAVGFNSLELVELPEGRGATPAVRMADEATRLVARCREADIRIVLDERGKGLTSAAFSERLRGIKDRSTGTLAFVIGGPDGHGPGAREAASFMLSLSPMTLPHGFARIMLVEQIYRATTILSGHPYHRV